MRCYIFIRGGLSSLPSWQMSKGIQIKSYRCQPGFTTVDILWDTYALLLVP